MPTKVKEMAETTEKAAPALVAEKQPEQPEKASGPLSLLRAASTSQPPPGTNRLPDELLTNADAGLGTPGRARTMTALQRSIGNRYVSRLVDTVATQPTLSTVPPVMRKSLGNARAIQRKCGCGNMAGASGECAECQAKEPMVQRQATEADAPSSLPPSVTEAMQSGGGEPLPETSRAQMENALGADLEGVRIHTSSLAARAAHDINAKAFTVGQNIYFGTGQYQPDAQTGQHLLAHELTHTVQQTNGRSLIQPDALISQPDDPLEREAETVANMVGQENQAAVSFQQSAPTQPRLATKPIVQRAWYDVITEGAEWVGGQIASGAEAAWEGAEWVGGQVASGAQAVWGGATWLAGKSWEEIQRIGGAAWECARALGRSVENIFSLNVSSLHDLLGIPAPTGESPPGILDTIISVVRHPCLQMIPGYTLMTGAVGKLSVVRDFLIGAWRVMENPDILIDAIRSELGGMISQIPEMAQALTRKAITFSEPLQEHLEGIWRHLGPKLEYLGSNWWEVLKETGWELLWPWPGVGRDLGEIWDHIKAGASDLWDLNFSGATDHLLAVWRTANNALGRLYGWFFLASVLVGAIIGAFFGGAGAIPGAAAGAKFALLAGQYLLISTIAAEAASIAKAGIDLAFTEQTNEEKEADYEQIANSGIVLAITGAMYLLGAIAARFARAVINRVAGRVWRRPPLRGRGTTSRGDVIEVRVAMAARVIGILRRRAVTWLETIRRNFPVIDLLEGGQINITPRPRRAPLYQVNGGRLISVKSTSLIGADAQAAIQAWIDDLANFTTVRNVTVSNPSGRTLMVAVQTPLDDAAVAALRTYARGRGVTIEMFTNLPPNHPALVFPDAIPSIMAEAGVIAADEANESHEAAQDEAAQESR